MFWVLFARLLNLGLLNGFPSIMVLLIYCIFHCYQFVSNVHRMIGVKQWTDLLIMKNNQHLWCLISSEIPPSVARPRAELGLWRLKTVIVTMMMITLWQQETQEAISSLLSQIIFSSEIECLIICQFGIKDQNKSKSTKMSESQDWWKWPLPWTLNQLSITPFVFSSSSII